MGDFDSCVHHSSQSYNHRCLSDHCVSIQSYIHVHDMDDTHLHDYQVKYIYIYANTCTYNYISTYTYIHTSEIIVSFCKRTFRVSIMGMYCIVSFVSTQRRFVPVPFCFRTVPRTTVAGSYSNLKKYLIIAKEASQSMQTHN